MPRARPPAPLRGTRPALEPKDARDAVTPPPLLPPHALAAPRGPGAGAAVWRPLAATRVRWFRSRILGALLLALLAACGTAPRAPVGGSGGSAGNVQRDGPLPNPPADLAAVPDAVPKIETLRSGGPNKPYEVEGRTYVPLTDDRPLAEKGLASWYGRKFHGRRTASGESYNMYAMSAAHKTMPIPSYARVRNPANGKEVIVRVNDRGPFVPGRVIDLSYTAALKLGVLGGVAPVEVERITLEEIRAGLAAPPSAGTAIAAAAAPAPMLPTAPPPAPPSTSPSPSPTAALPSAAAIATEAAAAVGAPPVESASAAPGEAAVATPVAPPAPAPAPAPSPAAQAAATALQQVADARARATTPAAAGFWVQIGAYRQRNGALDFQHRLTEEQPWLGPLLAVYSDGNLHRLQAGPYVSREQAREASERVRSTLQLVPVIVERR